MGSMKYKNFILLIKQGVNNITTARISTINQETQLLAFNSFLSGINSGNYLEKQQQQQKQQ